MKAVIYGFLAAAAAASCLAGQPSSGAGVDSPLSPPDNSAAIESLASRLEEADYINAAGFKHVAIDGVTIDFVASDDDNAIVFAVYPEEYDYVAVPRSDNGGRHGANELSATALDSLAMQREVLQKMATNACVRLAIVAGGHTLAGIRAAWGDELEARGVELVEYGDFESHLLKYFGVIPGSGFGLDASRPIRLVDIEAEYAYLRRLKNKSGEPARALPWGSFYVDGFDGPMDRWSVELFPDIYVDVFLYPYDPANTLVAPEGFSLDLDGIREEFAAFRLARPSPREVNEPIAEDDSEPAAVPDEKEIASVGPVLFPPPSGFVNLSSHPVLSNQLAKVSGDDESIVAAFGKSADGGKLDSYVIVFDCGDGHYVSLRQYREILSERKSSLYDRGIRAGVFAPHVSSARSLQWTTAKTYVGEEGPMIICSSHGNVWIQGRVFGLGSPVLEIPAGDFRMRHVEQSRKSLETWLSEILRANGIDPENADQLNILDREDFNANSMLKEGAGMPGSPKSEWWMGWSGFAIKMAVKVGLPLLVLGLSFLLGKRGKGAEESDTIPPPPDTPMPKLDESLNIRRRCGICDGLLDEYGCCLDCGHGSNGVRPRPVSWRNIDEDAIRVPAAFDLEILAPAKWARRFLAHLPSKFEMGRYSEDHLPARGIPFGALNLKNHPEANNCSRRYLRFSMTPSRDGFNVDLLADNYCKVAGTSLRMGENAVAKVGDTIEISPDWVFKVVPRK